MQDLKDWKEKYAYDTNDVKRIEAYMENNRHKIVMEIQKFQNTSSIPLAQIKKGVSGFFDSTNVLLSLCIFSVRVFGVEFKNRWRFH